MNQDLRTFPAILNWEFRLQWRYYFWVVAAVVTVVWHLLLASLSSAAKLTWLPVLLFADISNIGLLFIAGSLILERQQGTLNAIAVMPVGTGLWLAGKLISLTCLTSACGLVLTALNLDAVAWLRVVPAIVLTAAFFTSAGFILACPFQNILNYFLAMALATSILSLPLLSYFAIADSPLFWLVPSYPTVLLLEQAFGDATGVGYLATLLVCLAWISLSHYLGIRLFHRCVAARAGG